MTAADARPPGGSRVYRQDDFDFASEVQAAMHQGPKTATHLLLFAILGLFVAGIAWASWATVEEVTRGDGRVIPSRQMQVVQVLESGIIEEIQVQAGDIVTTGQILLRIDDIGFASELGELDAQRAAIRGQVARLEAELAGAEEITFPDDLMENAPQVVADERELFVDRHVELENQLGILRRQAEQRDEELAELRAAEEQHAAGLSLAQQELAVYYSLSPGLVPQVELLRSRQRVNELNGLLEQTRRSIAGAEAAIREAHQRIEDQFLQFRAETRTELNQRRAELAVIDQSLRGAEDRVDRTDVRSPVDGIVNRVNITTIGGVVQPGMDIIEIVPIEDSLLVEARVRPSDVAFLRPGMPATVKLTAYDFSVYGGLDGEVERISADTIVDEETGESFYQIIVRTQDTHLGNEVDPLPIIPGMVASVDILTGEKTILEYLLRPLQRTAGEALRER